MPRPDEFGLIARYFAPLTEGDPGAFDLSDDAAILRHDARREIVATTDCMVSGVHFTDDDGPDAIARKLLRVNLSDLAAKGARPVSYLLALALPRGTDETWLARFTKGLAEDQKTYGIHLVGGDTTATDGGLVATITAFGEVPPGRMVRRNGARAGDDVYVSGTIGDAALGLAAKQGRLNALTGRQTEPLLDRLRYPEPRVALGQRLLGVATSGLDVSDGLVQDAGHLAECSRLAIDLELDAVPLSAEARLAVRMEPGRLRDMIAGGDDYELLFTAAPAAAPLLASLSRELQVPTTRIGRCRPGQGVVMLDGEGREIVLEKRGFRHF